MPPAPDPSALKRKRPEIDSTGLADTDRKILNIIKSKKDLGIWIGDIKKEAKLIDSKLTDNVIGKSLKSLSNRNLIKEVVNFQHKVKKHFMAAEFEPSTEISGGVWYEDGNLNKELINLLKRLCLRFITMQKVSTLERVHNDLKKSRALTFDIASQQVGEILNSMVLDNEIIEVKSTGHGDYHGIPVNTTCYRAATGAAGASKGPIKGAFASIPCGACSRINLCTPDGVISPATCVYYNKWLDIDF